MAWRFLPVVLFSTLVGCGRISYSPSPPSLDPVVKPAREVTWAVISLNGSKVGFVKTTREVVLTEQTPLVQYEQTTHLRIQRYGETVENTMLLKSQETAAGEFSRCEWHMSNGMSCVATVDGDELKLRSTIHGETADSVLRAPPLTGGYFCLEQSLRNRPMSVGAQRDLTHLAPVVNQIVTVHLTAIGYEITGILGTGQELLRIEAQTLIGDSALETILWTNSSGEILKSLTPGIDEMLVRTDEKTALSDFTDPTDIGHFTAVKVVGRLVQPHGLRQATYRLSWPSQAGVFQVIEGQSQQVTSSVSSQCEITVRAIRPDSTSDPGHS